MRLLASLPLRAQPIAFAATFVSLVLLAVSPSAQSANVCSDSRVAATSERAITVDDLLQFSIMGNPQSLDWKGQNVLSPKPAILSPSENRVGLIVSNGNVADGTNDASIYVYRRQDLLHTRCPDKVFRIASATNFQPIALARWMDERTIVFAGTKGTELSQVYKLDVDRMQLVALTSESQQLLWFDIAPDNGRMVTIVDTAMNPPEKDTTCLTTGCLVRDERFHVVDRGMSPGLAMLRIYDLHAKTIHDIPDAAVLGNTLERCDIRLLGGISPDGRFALRACRVKELKEWWGKYTVSEQLRSCFERRNTRCYRQLMLVDLQKRSISAASDAPYLWNAIDPIWIDSGRYVLLPGALEPLIQTGEAVRKERARSFAVILLDPQTLMFTRVGEIPREAVVTGAHWEQKRETVTVHVSDANGAGTSELRFRRVGSKWIALTSRVLSKTGFRAGSTVLQVEQSLNDRPIFVAYDADSKARNIVLDPNSWLDARDIGRVEVIGWTASDGRIWRGALYYPPNFQPDLQYPLMIQTHGFEPDVFSMTGYARNFAGRALAALGIAVLQVEENEGPLHGTPQVWDAVMRGYEGAIDYLAGRKLIDPARVGIQGWSGTGPMIGYTLTHSKYPFAAGALTATADYGWLWYLSQGAPHEIETAFGAKPFGDGLSNWLKYSPTFNLDHVSAPMLMWSNSTALGLWDWYVGLRRLDKPVENWLAPDATHDVFHIGQRRALNQLLVDWFRFWLKSEEDADLRKSEQYQRWRNLRDQQRKNTAAQYYERR